MPQGPPARPPARGAAPQAGHEEQGRLVWQRLREAGRLAHGEVEHRQAALVLQQAGGHQRRGAALRASRASGTPKCIARAECVSERGRRTACEAATRDTAAAAAAAGTAARCTVTCAPAGAPSASPGAPTAAAAAAALRHAGGVRPGACRAVPHMAARLPSKRRVLAARRRIALS